MRHSYFLEFRLFKVQESNRKAINGDDFYSIDVIKSYAFKIYAMQDLFNLIKHSTDPKLSSLCP